MGRKTSVRIFQATNWRNLTREDLDMVKKEKLLERNWISSNNSKKQRHLRPIMGGEGNPLGIVQEIEIWTF